MLLVGAYIVINIVDTSNADTDPRPVGILEIMQLTIQGATPEKKINNKKGE